MTTITDPMVKDLIQGAVRRERWAAVIAAWGQEKGRLEEMVVNDLAYLGDNKTPAQLLERCLNGAEEQDAPSWQEYVDDLVAHAERAAVPHRSDKDVRTDERGYALGVRCELNHAGNKGYALEVAGSWQCQGCRASVATGVIYDRQQESRRDD